MMFGMQLQGQILVWDISESNLKCIYLATGFPENRSKFLVKAKPKDKLVTDEDEDEESMPRQGLVSVPGKEGRACGQPEIAHFWG